MSSADERGNLYKSAMEAWRRGETTTALGKLDQLLEFELQDLHHNPETVKSLRDLQEQVKADQAALKEAYEQARRHLAEGNSEEALSICEEHLSKYPGHPLFASLKLDVEAYRRRRISSFIAETDTAVEAEANLERRVEILEAAARRYPDEQHFQTALTVVRERLSLVQDVVADAQIYEKDHRYAEALDQWQTLATIHPEYAGLEDEIARVTELHERYAETEARRRLIDRVRLLMEEGEWERAIEAARDAAGRFPGDGEIAELEAAAQKEASRAGEARELFEHGREAYAARRFEEGLRHLRNSQRLVPDNREYRELLVRCLLERAGAEMESDWRAAERLVSEAAPLDPENAELGRLRAAVGKARETEQSAWRTIQAGRAGTPEPEAEPVAETPPPPAPEPPPPATLPKPPAPPPAETPEPSVTREIMPEELPREAPATRELQPDEIPASPLPPAQGARPAGSRRLLLVALVVVVAAVAAIAAASLLFRKGGSTPTPNSVAVDVQTSPPGARISIDGEYRGESNLEIPLAPGSYVLEAHADGYAPLRSTIEVGAGNNSPVALSLEPLPVSLRIFPDLGEEAKVALDGEPVEGSGDELVVVNLAPGDHTLTAEGRFTRASIAFTIEPGAPPRLTAPIEARQTVAVAIGQFGDTANAYCSCAPVPLLIDGDFAGKLERDGLPLQRLSYGSHELTLGEEDDSRQVALDTGPVPSLNVFLQSDRNVGTLVVLAGEEDGVSVVLNGRTYGRQTQAGRLRIPGVAAREHTVSVTKEGFEPTAPQTVTVRKGRVTTVHFDLEPEPQRQQLAHVVVRDALAGATLSVDGKVDGTIPSYGGYTLDLEPGQHTIELSKNTFRPRRISRTFGEGETVHLGLREVALEQILGTLRLDVQPPGAQLRLQRIAPIADAARPIDAETVRLAPGTYRVEASLDNYKPFSKTVAVPSGETVDLAVRLDPTTPLPPAEPTMEGWDNPGAWVRHDDLFVRRGGDYVTYGTETVAGVIEFVVHLQRGGRLRWFTSYKTPDDHALFEIDDSTFYRYEVAGGHSEQLAKVTHPKVDNDVYHIRLRVTEHEVVHELRRGDTWITMDVWNAPSRDFRQGKFGFYLRGRSQIGVESFSYRPQ